MEQILLEMLKQAPGLGVLAAVVWMFIRYLEKLDGRRTTTWEKRDGMLKEMHREHLDARVQDRLAIERNTEFLQKCSETIGAANETNCRVAEAVERIYRERER